MSGNIRMPNAPCFVLFFCKQGTITTLHLHCSKESERLPVSWRSTGSVFLALGTAVAHIHDHLHGNMKTRDWGLASTGDAKEDQANRSCEDSILEKQSGSAACMNNISTFMTVYSWVMTWVVCSNWLCLAEFLEDDGKHTPDSWKGPSWVCAVQVIALIPGLKLRLWADRRKECTPPGWYCTRMATGRGVELCGWHWNLVGGFNLFHRILGSTGIITLGWMGRNETKKKTKMFQSIKFVLTKPLVRPILIQSSSNSHPF